MAEMAANDVKDIDEPKSYREMFQKIMREIALLSVGVNDFKESQKCQDDLIKTIGDTQKSHGVIISLVKIIGSAMLVGLVAFLILILTGQLQIVRP